MKATLLTLALVTILSGFISLINYQDNLDKQDVLVHTCWQGNTLTYYALEKPTSHTYDMDVVGDCKQKTMKYKKFRETRYVIFPKRSRR